MPIKSNIPISIKITRIDIDLVDQAILLFFKSGFINDENKFIDISDAISVEIQKEVVGEIFSIKGDSSKSVYETIKNALYEYLIASGIVSGSIV